MTGGLMGGLPARLRHARLLLDMSQAQLADMAGLTQAAISHFEAGRRVPSLWVFVRLVVALGVSADWLLDRSPHGGPWDRQ